MFRAGLLLIIRGINSVWKANDIVMRYVEWLLASRSCQQPVNITHDYTNCFSYRVEPPDDEQQACSKHVEAYYWNKLTESNASCWFVLSGYITVNKTLKIKEIYSKKNSSDGKTRKERKKPLNDLKENGRYCKLKGEGRDRSCAELALEEATDRPWDRDGTNEWMNGWMNTHICRK